MIDLNVRSNSRLVAAALERGGGKAELAAHKVAVDYGFRALALVRRNASGRPGPNAPSGDYKRSWGIRFGLDGTVTVGTNAVQARRLEYGFFGTDSLGRNYRQRSYPHVGPAVREIRRPYEAALTRAVVDAVRKQR